MADQHQRGNDGSGNPGSAEGTIESVLYETRNYPPPQGFAEQANVNDPDVYERARQDPEGFWAEAARRLDWFTPWDRVLDWNPPQVEWFSGGRLNASYNCVDRHVKNGKGDKVAIIWEGEPEGDQRTLTYADLQREVNRAAAMLQRLGVQKGDRVAVYMPMIPELPILMLACARLGAPHSVVFAGFSPDSLADRINDCQAKLVVTADGGWRRGRVVPLKENVDAAVQHTPSVEHVVVVERVGRDQSGVTMREGRDLWWHDALPKEEQVTVEPEPLDAEHPLYILYTSGTTGKPKGILHTTGGYLTGTSLTSKWVFDLKDDDIYWCTADIGWVTGHSYIVYGPLSNGVTQVMYEGAPDWPDKDRFWQIIERHKVSVMYTAPTSIRSFMGWGREYPDQHDLSSLRLLGTVGEPINPEAWVWYHDVVGGRRCPIVDTWWQTETGAIMITPLPGITTTKPGSATFAFPGIQPAVVDERGHEVPRGQGGFLVITHPWPSMLRSIWGDPERYAAQYFGKYGPKVYVTGDGARQDEAGYFWLMGRVDDVLNVAGHRLGTMELESALVSHSAVAEAAVIGVSHAVKGQGIAAFCRLRSGVQPSDALKEELRQWVGEKIGPIARPDKVYLVSELPKTRSAKIMRRLLRDIAEGKLIGDTTTLTDPGVLEEIKQGYTE